MGMGGATGIMLIILYYTNYASGITVPMMVTLLLTGIVCTSRMIVSDHSQKEIYTGFITGVLFQFIAASYIL